MILSFYLSSALSYHLRQFLSELDEISTQCSSVWCVHTFLTDSSSGPYDVIAASEPNRLPACLSNSFHISTIWKKNLHVIYKTKMVRPRPRPKLQDHNRHWSEHRRRSSVNFRGSRHFCPKKICIKNLQNARILHDSCPKKISKFPNFTLFFPENS